MSMSIRETLGAGAAKYLELEEERFRHYLSFYNSPATIISCVYEYAVIDKEIEPIESLTIEEKKAFWIEAKKLKPGAGVDVLTKVAKALYLKSRL